MDIKDVMLYDWVRLTADDSIDDVQVTYIRKDGVGFDKWAHFFDEIEAIPLTLEMLKNNGWYIYDEIGDRKIAIRKDWHLTIVYKKDGDAYAHIARNWCFNVNYVHELQHALRLSNMNDVADNFKIN